MLEKSVFSNNEIKSIVLQKYNIKVTKIENEPEGSANIFYIYNDKNEKYVLKEFNSRAKEENIIKEIKILNHLKADKLLVPEYIKTVDEKFYFTYKERFIILMKYIEGYTKGSNNGNYEQTMESAQILGKLVNSLEKIGKLKKDTIEDWCNNTKIDKAKIEFQKILSLVENSTDSIDMKIRKYAEDRFQILNKLEKIDFKDMENVSLKNSHGDFSVMQFIYRNERVIGILDFEKARCMAICWEIIRSYTYIDEKCKNGDIDIDNLIDYVKEVMKYIKLTKWDLKYMAWFYLVQLATSPFGYIEFLENRELTHWLNFAFWRSNMCKSLIENMSEISEKLQSLI